MFKIIRSEDPYNTYWHNAPVDFKNPTLEHKSCMFNCYYMQFGSMPNRRCKIYSDIHIWSGDGENEFMELGYTVADLCPDFKNR